MTARNDHDAPIFSATLTPYRSLSPAGFGALMVFVGATCFGAGLLFWSIGAWPIMGFMGLDVLLVWLAFTLNYRAARAYEEIVVSRSELLIRKVSPRGRAREIRFNPSWVRLDVRRLEDEGVTRIEVLSRNERVPVAAFLNPDDRTSFATAFGAALAEARR
ncbi:DUF2244 domain-containing protein [Faunimonas sp. B44]|uniref:DUF2244 domain-containing protein n=1 Tax=Faunimonas sp. B44 TaxID=3461493 RepID=UPI004044F0A0